MDLEKIRARISGGKEIEEIVEEFDWKGFELFVKEILQSNEYRVFQNLRFKTNRRYEVDVTAVKNGKALCIDCKQWGSGRYKSNGLRNAAERQKERTEQLKKFIKGNPIAKNKLGFDGKDIRPLVVTWLQEDVIETNGTYIVPAWKLNSFLSNLEEYF